MKINRQPEQGQPLKIRPLVTVCIAVAALLLAWIFYEVEAVPFFAKNVWAVEGTDLKTMGDYAELREGDSFFENVHAAEKFRGARLYVASRDGQTLDGTLVMEVCNEAGDLLAQTSVTPQQVVGAQNLDFVLDQPLDTETGDYTLKFTMQGFSEDTVVAVYTYDRMPTFAADTAQVNGKESGQNLLRNLFCDYEKLKKIYWVLILSIIGGVTLLLLFWAKSRRSLAFNMMCTLLVTGILYGMVFQPFNTPDEIRHYGTAYRFASMLFCEDRPDLSSVVTAKDEVGYYFLLPVRTTDQDVFSMAGRTFSGSDYIKVSRMWQKPAADSLAADTAVSYPIYKDSAAAYLPTIAGICIGWLLHLNGIQTVCCARLVNLLVYCILVYYSIRLMPHSRTIIAMTSMLPMATLLSISCANDILILGLAFLCVALIVRIQNAKRYPHGWEAAVFALALLGCMVARQYHLVFLLVAFVVGCLIANLDPAVRKKIGIGALLAVLALLLVYGIKTASADLPAYETLDPGTKLGIGFVWKYPVRAATMLFQTIGQNGDIYFVQMIGERLGWLLIDPGAVPIFGFCILLLLSVIEDSGKEGRPLLYRMTMLLTGIFMMLSAFAIGFQWTSPAEFEEASSSLIGLQGRYFLPGLVPVLLGLRLPYLSRRVQKPFLMQASVLLHGYILLASFFCVMGLK